MPEYSLVDAPDIFWKNDTAPDPHGGIYSPRVLGRNGNYVNFLSVSNIETIWIDDTWLLNPDWSGASSSSGFYDHQYYLMDKFGYKNNGWIYSVHFGWMYIVSEYRNYNASEEVGYAWVYFPDATIGGNSLNWCFVDRNLMSETQQTSVPGVNYHFRIVESIGSGIFKHYGVTKGTNTNDPIVFTLLYTQNIVNGTFDFTGSGTQYTYSSSASSGDQVVPPTDPDGGTAPEFELPPVAATPFDPDGFEASNIICCGTDNYVQYSRRSTIINGDTLYCGLQKTTDLVGAYNCHIIGKQSGYFTHFSNRLHIHCDNGMHITGDIVSDRLSDNRLKDNFKKIKNSTNKIKKIRAVSFDWNEKQKTYTGSDIGLIAQDVESVIPEAVSDRENGFKGVQYHKVIPLLVDSIQEKQNRINNLKEKIESLKNGKL